MMEVIQEIQGKTWDVPYSPSCQKEALNAIESGKIVLLPELTFNLLTHENIFLSTQFSHPKSKNISFNPLTESVRGAICSQEFVHLKGMLKRYSEHATSLIHQLFPSYSQTIQIGRTSFRPIEIFGRIPKSYRKDDTRLHVDAFPMSPTQGKRIFRIFTNVNPHGKERLWRVGEPFIEVAKRFLPTVKKPWFGRSTILNALKLTKSYCTPYDYTMLQIHNNMKGDLKYQKEAPRTEMAFLPNTTWIVQTDNVTHAAISGQFVFEQTFYLPVMAMDNPALSPLRMLEKLTNRTLI